MDAKPDLIFIRPFLQNMNTFVHIIIFVYFSFFFIDDYLSFGYYLQILFVYIFLSRMVGKAPPQRSAKE